MADRVEKMNTDCDQSNPKKGKRTPRARNENNIAVAGIKPKEEADKENRGIMASIAGIKPKEEAEKEENKGILASFAGIRPKEEADKENRNIMASPKQRGRKMKESLKNVTNIIPSAPSLEEELTVVRMRLQKLNLEKERTDKLLEERDALLKQKEADLELRAKAQEELQLQLKKYQRLKEFKPVMSFPLEQSLRMGVLAKEAENKNKKSDPSRPKKPSPPYILWCQEQWNQLRSGDPKITFKDMGAILGEKWKALTAEQKKPYEEKYEAAKEAYLQVVGQEKRENKALKLLHEEQKQKTALDLLEQYLQYKKDAEGDEKSKRKGDKDLSKPKQPVTAFFAFTNERRAALLAEKHNVLEIPKILGGEWNNMTKEERAPYERIAAEAKEHYMQEMELYKDKKAEEANPISKEDEDRRKIEREQALRLTRKKEKTEILKKAINLNFKQKKHQREKNSDPNRPRKPPTSFILFSKETRKKLAQERPNISNATISALISIKWKELGDSEKQIWEDQAASAMAQYKKEMEEYNKKLKESTHCNVHFNQEMELGNYNLTTTTTTTL